MRLRKTWTELVQQNDLFVLHAGSSDQLKSKRASNILAAPTGLAQQMAAVNVQLKRSTSKSSDEEHCRQLKQSLLDQLEVIAPYLPPNTLDELIDELGGPNYVAEVGVQRTLNQYYSRQLGTPWYVGIHDNLFVILQLWY